MKAETSEEVDTPVSIASLLLIVHAPVKHIHFYPFSSRNRNLREKKERKQSSYQLHAQIQQILWVIKSINED